MEPLFLKLIFRPFIKKYFKIATRYHYTKMLSKAQKKLIQQSFEIVTMNNKIEKELEKIGLFNNKEEQTEMINRMFIKKSKMISTRSISLNSINQ